MKVLVHTQHIENYGAHCEDGLHSSGNYYWKFKGGQDYLVENVNDREANAVALVLSLLDDNSTGGFRTFVTGWEVVSDLTIHTDWELEQLDGEGEIWDAAIRIDYSDRTVLAEKEGAERLNAALDSYADALYESIVQDGEAS